MEFTGFLKKLNTKTGTGRHGKWTLYSGKIAKADGSEYDEWVSFGFDKPDAEEGGYYIIETEKDAKGYEKVTSVKAATPPKGAETSSGGSPATGGSNARQDSIIYQNARGNALTFVELAVKLDALPFIASPGKSAQAKRFAELQALVDKLTVQFFNDTDTLRLLDSIEDAGAEDEAKPGASDEDDNSVASDDDE